MYQVKFYRDAKGYSPVEAFLDSLQERALTNKDARIQLKQIAQCIDILSVYGTRINANTVKHLTGDIWELRPGNNRIMFFYFKNNTFILLHHFRKRSQKTPEREIARAIYECNDWKKRKE